VAQAQRKKKQIQHDKRVNNSKKAFAVLAVCVAAAAAIAIGMSSGSSAPAPSDGQATIITGQFQDVTVTGALLPQLPSGDDPAVGTPAPGLSGFDFRGNTVNINTAESRANTLMVFLAHWCPHCNDEIPKLIEWREQGLIPADLRVVGITTGSRNDAPNWPPSDWISEKKWPFEVLADNEEQTAALAYGLSAYPFMAIVDANGILQARFSGVVGPDALSEIVAAALK
jgi:cytochrome c biogenesis protein CcmG/thiol:disulfide interchange protein DsbE